MATPTAVHTPALASSTSISDRAFRVFYALAMELEQGWVPVPRIAAQLNMTSHQIRLPLAELRAAGIVERERRYEKGATGRPTWHTYIRLTDDTTAEAAA
ncbi:hypothetical protein ACWCV2_17505 [Streptomyces pseudogriseolus]